jgi:hypothetical protein
MEFDPFFSVTCSDDGPTSRGEYRDASRRVLQTAIMF